MRRQGVRHGRRRGVAAGYLSCRPPLNSRDTGDAQSLQADPVKACSVGPDEGSEPVLPFSHDQEILMGAVREDASYEG